MRPETPSFYFYDLETSGLNPRTDRIMQFAGQRTDLEFNPIGEPHNILVALPDDTLPSPGAIMVTGITPNKTRTDGLSEREFCQFFIEEIATPGTTILGYNSVRFDDEFIRHTLWRNFHDPYAWHWREGRSRWDLLDVVRLTRALRPEGIEWPVTPDGHSTNRLELLTKLNHIAHTHAHDALSDVEALISVTKLVREKQPQLFEFLYQLREKRAVANLVSLETPRPFVYASGRYPSKFEKTTVAYPIAPAENGAILVFDLRYNLDELLAQEAAAKSAESSGSPTKKRRFSELEPWERQFFPIVKKLQYNHCPAVAPLGVLEKDDGWRKISLDTAAVEKNLKSLRSHPDFIERMAKIRRPDFGKFEDAESALYSGFLNESDNRLCNVVRNNGAEDLADFHPNFNDDRLAELLLHYKAKNFPTSLAADETEKWEAYRAARLNRQAPKFLEEIASIQKDLAADKPWGGKSIEECSFLVEELLLWYESLQETGY